MRSVPHLQLWSGDKTKVFVCVNLFRKFRILLFLGV